MNQYRLPVGLKDYYGSRLDTKEQLRHYLFQRFDQLGYHKIQTPLLEYEPVLLNTKPSHEIFIGCWKQMAMS